MSRAERRTALDRDFIAIKAMEGELKLSHKRKQLGLTVTTEQLIIQKPHVNYYISLLSIISIRPEEIRWNRRPLPITHGHAEGSERVYETDGLKHYRLDVQEAKLHNRSGIRELGRCEFVLPMTDQMVRLISQYAELNAIE